MNFSSWRWLAALVAMLVTSAAHAQAAVPYHVLTHYDVLPAGQALPAGDSALTLLTKYAAAAGAEPGATSVSVLTDVGRASRFAVVEVWASQAAYTAHTTAASATQLKAALAAWLVGPSDERAHTVFK